MSVRPDPLIDEVREARRQVCAEFDNDVSRLSAHLREIERAYLDRTGAFSTVPRGLTAELFPDAEVRPKTALDDVRAVRRGP